MKAIWNGVVLAESNDTILVEGNHYFPVESIQTQYFRPSEHHTICSWKGTASYYSIEVNGEINENAAWYYPEPKELAAHVKSHVAFWKGVRVEA